MEKRNSRPSLTYFFMILCIIVFVLEVYLQYALGEEFLNYVFNEFGLSLQNIMAGRIWVLFTSIFVHATPEHLVMNVLALYFFGKTVEQELGRKKFLLSFFVASLIADMFVLSSAVIGITDYATPTIGASAAIFGLMGIAMVVKPMKLIFYPYLIPIPLVLVALVYTLYNIATFILVLSGTVTSDVSYVSHIGGLIGGLFLGLVEGKSKKGFVIMLFVLLLIITTPFIASILGFLENFNYVNIIAGLLGR
jgi:membrane associated rhomboid family serine protease